MKRILVGLVGLLALALVAMACGSDAEEPRLYFVSAGMDEDYAQEDLDAVQAAILSYDSNADVLVLEIFPPIARATVSLEDEALCDDIVAELEAIDHVREATCEPAPEPSDNPDEPVSDEPG